MKKKKISKTEARAAAKDILMSSLAVAYYSLEGMQGDGYSDEEKDMITGYINQYGETMAKSIGEKYYTM